VGVLQRSADISVTIRIRLAAVPVEASEGDIQRAAAAAAAAAAAFPTTASATVSIKDASRERPAVLCGEHTLISQTWNPWCCRGQVTHPSCDVV